MRGKIYFFVFSALLMTASCGFFAASVGSSKDPAVPVAASLTSSIEVNETGSSAYSGYILHDSQPEGEFPTGAALMVLNLEEDEEIILASYRNQMLRDDVLAFFQSITGSEEVADLILFYSSIHNIPPALAFSLCAEESGYKTQAYNRNQNETVDRGLFQLNSASFPALDIDDFYNPAISVRYGLAHLRWCLDTAGTEIAALAMYNAGEARVRSTGTPKKTLDYISRIISRQRKIEGLFIAKVILTQQGREVIHGIGKKEPMPLRFSLLTPVGW